MNIDAAVQRDLDTTDGVLPWTQAYAEQKVKDRWGKGAWARIRKSKYEKTYRRVVGVGTSTIGQGKTWEEAFQDAIR